MEPETPYRIALMVILGLMMIVVPYRRWQARSPAEQISRKEEGPLIFVSLPIAGLSFWIGTLVYLVAPQWMQWARLPLPSWLRWIGAGIGVIAIGLISWTLAHLGRNLTNTVVVRSTATLVTTGPYRFVRHPFYVAGAMLLFGTSLLTANGFIGLSGLLLIALLVLRTAREEQKLIERFGDQYRAYMGTTDRFWPKLFPRQR